MRARARLLPFPSDQEVEEAPKEQHLLHKTRHSPAVGKMRRHLEYTALQWVLPHIPYLQVRSQWSVKGPSPQKGAMWGSVRREAEHRGWHKKTLKTFYLGWSTEPWLWILCNRPPRCQGYTGPQGQPRCKPGEKTKMTLNYNRVVGYLSLTLTPCRSFLGATNAAASPPRSL